MHDLCQLIALSGMQTDPDKFAGTERLAVSALRPEIGLAPSLRFSARDISVEVADMAFLEPHGVFFTKGYTRSFCMNTVLLCCYECPEFLKARLPWETANRRGECFSLARVSNRLS